MNIKLTEEEELFEKKKLEVKKMVKNFVFLTRDQIIDYLDSNYDLADQILSQLVKKQEIAVFDRDENGEPIEYVADKHIDKKTNTRNAYERAFNIYLALRRVMDIGEFCVGADSEVIMSFEVKREIYDIVRVCVGEEAIAPANLHMKERYLPIGEKEKLHRIVMLDDEKQLVNGMSDIEGLEKVVAVDYDGNIKDIPVRAEIDEKTGEKTWYLAD